MSETKEELNRLFRNLAYGLKNKSAVFNAMWHAGYPVWDDSIQTACVAWDKNTNKIQFRWNPKHFESLTYEQRQFVLCHEMIHVLNRHMQRMDHKQQEKWNQAADVVVNEGLVSGFGFDKNTIDPTKKYCWYDTVFKGNPNIAHDQNIEYYSQYIPDRPPGSGPGTIDGHDWSTFDKNAIDSIVKEIKESCDDDTLKDFVKNSPAGTQKGMHELLMPGSRFSINKKWETVIKKWMLESSRAFSYKTDWTEKSRMASALAPDIVIPNEKRLNVGKGKIPIYMFLDTSGSCIDLAPRFFNASKTLDPERFKVTLCGFSTTAYHVIDGKLKDFGGTNFQIMEDLIQKDIREGRISKYPAAVFVLTDGMGSPIKPEKPENWHWFLSYDYKHYIPAESKSYMLSEYE